MLKLSKMSILNCPKERYICPYHSWRLVSHGVIRKVMTVRRDIECIRRSLCLRRTISEQGRRELMRECKREEREYRPPREKRTVRTGCIHCQKQRGEKNISSWGLRYQPRDESILDLIASPLFREIINHLRLEDFRCLTLAFYDGVGNPKNHILNFQTLMVLHTREDHIFCKTFVTTLHSFTYIWFINLPLYFVTSLYNFTRSFAVRFTTGVPTKRTSEHLFSVI